MLEVSLRAVRPVLLQFADGYRRPVAEPADEIALIEEGMREYRKNPSSFVPLDDID